MRVRLMSMNSRQISHGLEHGEIEAGLTYLDNEPLARVDAVPLWRERYLLVTAADAAFGASVTWAQAASLPLCLLTPDMQHRRIVDGAFAAAGATPNPAVETNSVSTLVAHARAGLPGITADTWLDANPLSGDLRCDPARGPGDRAHDRARHVDERRADAGDHRADRPADGLTNAIRSTPGTGDQSRSGARVNPNRS